MNWFITLSTATAASESLPSWANLTATGIIALLLVWIITKAFPAMLERHDTVQQTTREHFERILNNIDASRAISAKEGHDAARELGSAIDKSTEMIRQNTHAVEGLSHRLNSSNV